MRLVGYTQFESARPYSAAGFNREVVAVKRVVSPIMAFDEASTTIVSSIFVLLKLMRHIH